MINMLILCLCPLKKLLPLQVFVLLPLPVLLPVSPTTSALYVYDGDNNAWKEYTTEEAKVTVVEPGVYESLGTDMIEEPETVLPAYLKQKYPYAAAESVVAVIYNEKANTPVVAEYTLGENWIETTSSRLVTTTFTQDAEGSVPRQACT